MKKKIILSIIFIIICITVVLIIILINNKKESSDKFTYTPPMYKICDSDSCIYILGSIHTGDERVTKFNSVIIDAYNNSDSLAVELDIQDINLDINEFILENGTIDDYISEEFSEKLIKFSNNHSLFPIETLKYMKLGYLYDYISLLPYIENGYNNEGVDSYFITLAKKDNKQIISLETYEKQLNMLIGSSNELYIKHLEYIIDNYDEVTKISLDLYNAYLEGDEKKLTKLIEEDKEEYETDEEKEYIKALYDDRNIEMSKKVEEFLTNNNKVFMTVGTAHVIGHNGIIELLKDKYKISKVK